MELEEESKRSLAMEAEMEKYLRQLTKHREDTNSKLLGKNLAHNTKSDFEINNEHNPKISQMRRFHLSGSLCCHQLPSSLVRGHACSSSSMGIRWQR